MVDTLMRTDNPNKAKICLKFSNSLQVLQNNIPKFQFTPLRLLKLPDDEWSNANRYCTGVILKDLLIEILRASNFNISNLTN